MTLAEYLDVNRHKPFVWGEHDCVTFVSGWVKDQTGYDHIAKIRPWKGHLAAERLMLAMGGLVKVLDDRFERINPHLAQDGDIGFHDASIRLFSGIYIVGPGHSGLVFLPRAEARCAWRF
jgi:hypothetical protein